MGCGEEEKVARDESLKRWEIVHYRSHLKTIMHYGEKVSNAKFSLYYCHQSKLTPTSSELFLRPTRRVAFLLNHQIKGAVIRNQLKRRLREIYRRNKEWFPAGFDYIIKARAEATELDLHHLAEELHSLTKRIKRC